MSNRVRNVFASNAIAADRLTAAERLSEIAALLAVGLVRLRALKSSRQSLVPENCVVDFTAGQSGDAVETDATENA